MEKKKNRVIVSRIRFNEEVALIAITDSSYDKQRIAAKVMRKVASIERKNNKPVMHIEIAESDAQKLFATTKVSSAV